MADYRISKDGKVDSLEARRENRLPLVPVDPTISTSPELGSIVFDPSQLRPYFGTGSAWVSLTTLTDIAAGTGLTYTIAGGIGTFALADTAAVPGTYGSNIRVPQITVDQQGRLTAASDVAIGLQIWGYSFTGAGAGFPPTTILPLWDTQDVGAAGFVVGNSIWTCQEAGIYRLDSIVGTADLINPNTATLSYSTAAAPATIIPLGTDESPPALASLKSSTMLSLGVGDIVYVTSGDLGCVTQSIAPTRGSPSRLLITKVQ